MRRLLRFLNFIKRARTPSSVVTPAARPHNPSRAGEARPRKVVARGPNLAAVVGARKRDRWTPPDLEGPEFGGLIERRGAHTRGLMPPPWRPDVDPEHKPRQPSQLGSDPGHVNVTAGTEASPDPESTGMFLAALDNSAITLADSGLFRIGEEPETDADADGFNPYGRTRGDRDDDR